MHWGTPWLVERGMNHQEADTPRQTGRQVLLMEAQVQKQFTDQILLYTHIAYPKSCQYLCPCNTITVSIKDIIDQEYSSSMPNCSLQLILLPF